MSLFVTNVVVVVIGNSFAKKTDLLIRLILEQFNIDPRQFVKKSENG